MERCRTRLRGERRRRCRRTGRSDVFRARAPLAPYPWKGRGNGSGERLLPYGLGESRMSNAHPLGLPAMRGGSILGHPVRRVEDPDLVTGAARYVGDMPADDCLHASFVRSTLAHARITGIETAESRGMAGVAGVFTARVLDLPPIGSGATPEAFARPVLASVVVRFVGEAVAVVVAETSGQAAEAAEACLIDYDPLP